MERVYNFVNKKYILKLEKLRILFSFFSYQICPNYDWHFYGYRWLIKDHLSWRKFARRFVAKILDQPSSDAISLKTFHRVLVQLQLNFNSHGYGTNVSNNFKGIIEVRWNQSVIATNRSWRDSFRPTDFPCGE